MKMGISASLTMSLITFFVLGIAAASPFLLSINFESAFAQTDTPIQEDGKSKNNLSNNTVAYSYNIYSNNNNTREAATRLHNSSVSYYDNNTTGYLVYPELANNTQQQELMPAVIIIHEWFGLNETYQKPSRHISQGRICCTGS